MSFDFINISILFQIYINKVLYIYFDVFYITFIDDILIYSKIFEEYIEYIYKILKKFLEYDLYIKLEKYQFHI